MKSAKLGSKYKLSSIGVTIDDKSSSDIAVIRVFENVITSFVSFCAVFKSRDVAFACGSKSTNNVLKPCFAKW